VTERKLPFFTAERLQDGLGGAQRVLWFVLFHPPVPRAKRSRRPGWDGAENVRQALKWKRPPGVTDNDLRYDDGEVRNRMRAVSLTYTERRIGHEHRAAQRAASAEHGSDEHG
jgi:hypothetical protein